MDALKAKKEHDIHCLTRSLIKELNIGESFLQDSSDMKFNSMSRFLRLKELASFLYYHRDRTGLNFIEDLLEECDITYTLSQKEKKHIPDHGRLLVVANRPFGGLEALLLARAISEVRSDLLVVSDDPIFQLMNLNALTGADTDKEKEEIIGEAMNQEKAVLVFPAKRISAFKPGKWDKEFLSYATTYQADVLPVYVSGRNSELFNLLRYLNKGFTRKMLVREIFNKRGKSISIRIGNPIAYQGFQNLKTKTALRLLRKHLLAIASGKKGYFKTTKNVIHRVDREKLREDIFTGQPLGYTEDHKMILLIDYKDAPHVMEEIARLRESTFRLVGEGTGSAKDTDDFDRHYKHLVLWDDRELEIVGAYRLGIGKELLEQKGQQGFYSNTLFSYGEELERVLPDAIECGRSFVQPKYWNSMALDYLWHGIGAYIAKNPQIKYLFGPVSISQNYQKEARDMLIYFYTKWFGARENLAKAKRPYGIKEETKARLDEIFSTGDYKKDFKALKQNLKHFGLTVPTLYKQYADLCEEDGVHFLDFGIDPDFANCVDGLILVELPKLKEKKRARYIDTKHDSNLHAPNLSSYFTEAEEIAEQQS